MRVRTFLALAVVAFSTLNIGCDEETKQLNISNFEKPTISIDSVTISTSNLGIVLSGSYKTVNSDEKISECGFYYYSEKNKDSIIKTPVAIVNNTFSVSLLLKDYGTTYYYKAYISNGVYSIESEEKSFKLLDLKDYVRISSPGIVSSNSGTVILKSDINQASGVNITEKGVIVGATEQLTIDSTHYVDKSQSSTINVTVNELAIGSKYYFRSYIKDGEYLAYSNTNSFIPHAVPSISTVQVNNIDYYSAYSGGYNICSNGLDIISKGIVWSKTVNPTVGNSYIKSLDISDEKEFTCQLTDLDPGITYYVRAFATNSDGTGYGEEFSFATIALKRPTISTDSIWDITSSSVKVSGKVISDGGTSVTERGIVLGTSHNPTVESGTKTISGNGLGGFTCSFSELLPGTTYYVRAYAINSVGVEYGAENSFTTNTTLPTVNSISASDITSSSAVISGAVTAAGGTSVTERGIVWSTSDNPTIENNKKISGDGLGEFSVTLSDLAFATTYFVRAYAINSVGVSYGSSVSFTTNAILPVLSTASITSITSNSAVSGGEITSDGGATVTARGVVWNKEENPTTELSTKTTDGTGSGSFSSSITGLEPGITYHVRAYATNSIGTAYGPDESFTTLTTIPSVITSAASDISPTTATVAGNVTATGGAEVTERGIVWGTTESPTVDDNKEISGKGHGEFSVALSNLTIATTYYARAYAVNSVGVAYGNMVQFTTGMVKPTISTVSVTSITSSSAISGGNITSDGGSTVTARGVVWSTDNNPNIELTTKTADGTGSGVFSSNITGLEPGVTYYVRAYATNSIGTSYGSEESFTTKPILSTVSTSSASEITSSSFKIGGNVTATGGADVTERGVVWGTSEDPTIDDNKKTSGKGLGEFSVTLSELTFATTYYVRAYAVNAAGVSYGSTIAVTTNAILAELSTASITSITSSSAVSGGNISSDGGAIVSARGVVWSTEKDPTISLSTKTADGTGSGSFTSNISGLEPGVKYYVRAYATNSKGTSYGSEESFTTKPILSTVSTSSASDITSSSFKIGGNVTASGGADITERGVVWDTTEEPTIDDNKKSSGEGLGEFTVTLSELTFATTYYVRAYAVNSAGVSYGNSVTVTTEAILPELSTVSITSITSSSAVSGGNISSDGGAIVTARGVVWSTEKEPTINLTTKTVDGTGSGEFSSNITGLEPGVTYYVRAYATNSIGTAYGTEVSFTADINLPSVTTNSVSSVSSTTISIGGNVTSEGGGSVIARGVVWSTTENPTVELTTKTADGSGYGSYTSSITELQPNTVYYIRAYATNAKGTAYGEQVTVQTKAQGSNEDVGNEDYEW